MRSSMHFLWRRRNSDSGMVLLMTLLVVTMVTVIIGGVAYESALGAAASRSSVDRSKAYYSILSGRDMAKQLCESQASDGSGGVRHVSLSVNDGTLDVILVPGYAVAYPEEARRLGIEDDLASLMGGEALVGSALFKEMLKVNVNTASEAVLREKLSYAGALVVNTILSRRSQEQFKSIEELKPMSGVTLAVYKRLEADLCVTAVQVAHVAYTGENSCVAALVVIEGGSDGIQRVETVFLDAI